ncbi:MAG: SDR family NAD(P)-dependent oxidoreductase [Sedimentisphaerales bacterium]|nr:SDR family NAD(P)-dependent oxidoreductase [Sedimentisphaerales bacterium]
MELANKVALVTGSAGKGMGRSIALTLTREGAKVAVNYRTSKDAAEAVTFLCSGGGQVRHWMRTVPYVPLIIRG